MGGWRTARQRQQIARMAGRNDGEKYAAWYLKQQGYCILEQNYSLPYAEIDLIVQRQDTLVFVEVKHRSSLKYGRPSEFVTSTKQQKIRNAALQYIQSHRIEYREYTFRFDVIEVLGAFTNDALPKLNHIPNAF